MPHAPCVYCRMDVSQPAIAQETANAYRRQLVKRTDLTYHRASMSLPLNMTVKRRESHGFVEFI